MAIGHLAEENYKKTVGTNTLNPYRIGYCCRVGSLSDRSFALRPLQNPLTDRRWFGKHVSGRRDWRITALRVPQEPARVARQWERFHSNRTRRALSVGFGQ